MRSQQLFMQTLVSLSIWLSLAIGADEVKAMATFDGIWDSEFGAIVLHQNGKQVNGVYTCCMGTIEGEVEGRQLRFKWEDRLIDSQGTGEFTLSEDGNSLEGVRWPGNDPTHRWSWPAKRFEEPTFSGTPTYWTVKSATEIKISGDEKAKASASVQGVAVLYFLGDTVTGKIEGNLTRPNDFFNLLNGSIQGDNLKLNWHNPYEGSSGTMTLIRRDRRIEGSWQIEGRWSFMAVSPQKGTIVFDQSDTPVSIGSLRAGIERMAAWDSSMPRGMQLIEEANLHMHTQQNNSRGAYESAYEKSKQAADLFRQIGDEEWVARALIVQGQAQGRLGNYGQAVSLYKDVLKLKSINDELRGIALDSQAGAQVELGNYEEARQLYAEVLELNLPEKNYSRSSAESGLQMINKLILGVPGK